MNLLFERFVQKRLQKQLPHLHVRFQKPQRKLFDETGTFPLKPDIVICNLHGESQVVAVIDAKWKLLGRDNVSSGDAYQMVAYGTAYDCKRLALIYPQTGDFQSALCGKHQMRSEMGLEICQLSLPAVNGAKESPSTSWAWLSELDHQQFGQ
jgi:5-methylcytosine-specific restriction endonuclease McrBC regulatory subunit McrC